METFASRVKSRRKEVALSQEELAERSGLGQSDISKIERGLILETTKLAGLAKALNCSPYWLESGDGPKESMHYSMQGEAGLYKLPKQIDPPAPQPGEASATAMEIALLYDLIPVTDRIRRTKAYNAATKAILAVLEEQPPNDQEAP